MVETRAVAPWRRILPGKEITVAIVGPLAGGIVNAIRESEVDADVWVVSQLPAPPPTEFLNSVRGSGRVLAIEEHTATGRFGH